eukprot:CAMPEP_0177726662 /NCGR_PEP_ID=MMETSP0484_2-20121128/19895_1 /TAXON_ID=354590 /ORGANISM="Rhodomonas lens, Strain RHODO" /LENGTH=49 /DNA_ID=CAMNT_0019239239 /DNA_START=1 /DNA_END=150 /DNA_ORIENTATION=+
MFSSLDHLGDSTALHSFNADPFQARTTAILEKAAATVEHCGDRQRACFN